MKQAAKLRVITPGTPLTARELARCAVAEHRAKQTAWKSDAEREGLPLVNYGDPERVLDVDHVLRGSELYVDVGRRVSWWGRLRGWLS